MIWNPTLVIIAIIYASGVPGAKTWMFPESICCEKQIGGSFISELGQKIFEVKEQIKWSLEGWHLIDICDISCQFLFCLFTRKPTEDEICQQSRYRNHECCQRQINAGNEVTTTNIHTEISSRDNLNSTEQLSPSPPPPPPYNQHKPNRLTKTGFMPDG